MENWISVIGFENIYEVSNLGRVKSLRRKILIRGIHNGITKEKILKQNYRGKGYLSIRLCDNKTYSTHRLVLCSFNKKRLNDKLHVNHINENKVDNRLVNLEFCDNKYNSNYGSKNNKLSKSLTKNKIKQIDDNGEVVKIWDNAEYALKEGFNSSHISKCCRGIRNKHSGFRWEYVD